MSPTWMSDEPPVVPAPQGLQWLLVVVRGLILMLLLGIGLLILLLLRLLEKPIFDPQPSGETG